MISKSLRWDIFERDGFSCQYCGQTPPFVELHIDHVKPRGKSGNSLSNNLITSCATCNAGKRLKTVDPGRLPKLIQEVKQRPRLSPLAEEVRVLRSYIFFLETLVRKQKKVLFRNNLA